MNHCLNQPPLLLSCYPKIGPVVSRNTECTVICQKKKRTPNRLPDKRGERGWAGGSPASYYKRAVTARQRRMKFKNKFKNTHYAAGAEALKQEDCIAHTYCERGEGHAHAPEAVESQGDEDKDGEFCKQYRC